MRVLVACEFSGVVRDAFAALGHDAWSCDFLRTERPGNHFQGDVRKFWRKGIWDLVIAHPPCTHLACSGARWFPLKERSGEQREALEFVAWFFQLPGKVAVENPVGIISSQIKRPTQIVQPWQFGHPETKATCLWLQGGLRPLTPTHIDSDLFSNQPPRERAHRIHFERPSPDRWKNRSRTYTGIAAAMAAQWGGNADPAAIVRFGHLAPASALPPIAAPGSRADPHSKVFI